MDAKEDLSNSQTSINSTIQLPEKYETFSSSSSFENYSFLIRLDSYQNIKNLIQNESTFWFSWSLLDITIQTAVFDINYPEAANETITIQCTAPALAKFLMDLPALRIYLCVPNKIITYLEVPFPRDIILPLHFSGWFTLISPADDHQHHHQNSDNDTLVHVTVDVQKSSLKGQKLNQNHQEDEDIDNENHHEETPNQKNNDQQEELNENSFDPEYDTKKFRLSFQIRSIRALKRAAHISLQFAYPYLGVSSSPIRTHGLWCLAHSETLIEGATVSYEFQMIFSQLLIILQQNKLIVNVISRTQLGTDRLGDATIDLNTLHSHKSVNLLYRCPLTGKQFKSLDQYKRHRQTMIALYTLGRINEVPSKSPIIIRSIELFVPILGKISSEVVGKLRCILILEQLGVITPSINHQSSSNELLVTEDNLFKNDEDNSSHHLQHSQPPQPPPPPPPPTLEEEEVLRRLDWEEWRRKEEEKWIHSLHEKELKLRSKLEEEITFNLSQKADDLHRAQEEVCRLEIRLRTSLDLIEKQKLQLQLKEEQMNLKLGQKTEELNLLQKKIREEGKNKIETEKNKNKILESQLKLQEETIQRLEKRVLDVEKEYDNYRQYVRSTPEIKLREELSQLNLKVSEFKIQIEIEKKKKYEIEIEKEYYRSQVHRVAMALKREREKNSVMARQELEQLRLEFLAREERYVLDGDREELRYIREELSHLRSNSSSHSSHTPPPPPSSSHLPPPSSQHSQPQQQQMKPIPPFPSSSSTTTTALSHYDTILPTSSIISLSLQQQQQHSPPPQNHQKNRNQNNQNQINHLKQIKQELLQSNLYNSNDSVIQEINEAIYQQQIIQTKQIDAKDEDEDDDSLDAHYEHKL